eukprot:COSAG01_NODE_1396_length_10474_cov_4.096482_3_plen_82_part_00
MGSAWRHSSTRHGDKLSFGVYNPGGVSNYKWAIIKEHFQRTDLLGIPEFSHSAGAYNGNKLAADEGGQLLVPPSPSSPFPS